MSNYEKELMQLRWARCPDEKCRQHVLYQSMAASVVCGRCSRMHPVEHLRNVEKPTLAEYAFQWLQWRATDKEKSSKMGPGRWRMASRAVDGISCHPHAVIMQKWFESYGVTRDGEVKPLKEMGRSSPINVVTLSDYAFGIRDEDLLLCGYGRDEDAYKVHAATIQAVHKMNGRKFEDVDALIPLYQGDRRQFWDSSAAVSKACTGREVFARAIRNKMKTHMERFKAEYVRRASGIEIDCAAICNTAEKPPILGESRTAPVVVDLAVLANLLRRTIVLLDVDRVPSLQAFVPFLSNPIECRNRFGNKRPPLLLAWEDTDRTYKVAVVAPTTRDGDKIDRIHLPREWIKSVWGHPEDEKSKLLDAYIDFNQEGRFVFGHGIFFKPEFLRDYVNAFEEESVHTTGVHPAIEVDFLTSSKDNRAAHGNCTQLVLTASAERRLWRCMRCGVLALSKDNETPSCEICGEFRKVHMRHQMADGAIEYKPGDHTTTLAPTSWCFIKRKHFYFYEFDNAGLVVPITCTVSGNKRSEQIVWFDQESNPSYNSDFRAETTKMVEKYNKDASVDSQATMYVEVSTQLHQSLYKTSILDHRMRHLYDSLGVLEPDQLLDVYSMRKRVTIEKPSSTLPDAEMKQQVRNILETGTAMMNDFHLVQKELEKKKELDRSNVDLTRELREASDMLAEVENGICKNLENAMNDYEPDKRWMILRTERSLFERGGPIFESAQRSMGNLSHFKLPLFGNKKFAFCSNKPAVVVCLENGGGHFHVEDSARAERDAAKFKTISPPCECQCRKV